MLGWIDTLLQGILLGGLYSLYATGLSVIFGIMRLVNIAHGDLIVLVSFLLLTLTTRLGLSVIVATAIVVPITFGPALISPYHGFAQDTIQIGDTLSALALKWYGDANLWSRLFEANRDQVVNPNLIYPGQVLRIPQ